MNEEVDTKKKFIIGWLTLKPGKRDEFMTLSRSFVEATRQEKGVIFFEFHHDLANSDGIVVIECYEDREAHEIHHQTPHFQAIWKEVHASESRQIREHLCASTVERCHPV